MYSVQIAYSSKDTQTKIIAEMNFSFLVMVIFRSSRSCHLFSSSQNEEKETIDDRRP